MKNPDTFMASKCMLYKSPQWSYEKEWRHMIAKEKGIKEYQMYIDNRSYDYSMRFKGCNA